MLSDERQIVNLIHRYAELQDAADFERVAALFRGAAFRVEGGPSAEGAQAVLALKRAHDRVHPDGSLRTKHVTTNVRIELDEAGRSARACSSFQVFQATDRLPLQCIVAGRYEDRFEKIDGEWQFRDRWIRPDLVGDLSEHTRGDPLGLR
ncbi:MAG: nuclear transport factor 2 family protein [Myxococcota bacterium]